MNNNAIVTNRHCCNCAHFGTNDGVCNYRMLPESVACENWDPKEEPKLSMTEHVQRILINKKKSYERGYIMAQLHLMCEAACQFMPNYKNEWERIRDVCEKGLYELWKNCNDKKR